jgi:hypothetical protein
MDSVMALTVMNAEAKEACSLEMFVASVEMRESLGSDGQEAWADSEGAGRENRSTRRGKTWSGRGS